MNEDSFQSEILTRLGSIKIHQLYNFKNFIRTEIFSSFQEEPITKSTQPIPFLYKNREKDIHLRMAKTKGVLFDIHVIDKSYNDNKEELIIVIGTGKIEIFTFDLELLVFNDIITLSDENEEYCCMDIYYNSEYEEEDYKEYIMTLGGEKGCIRVFSFAIHNLYRHLYEVREFDTLIGHKDSINDLKINQIYKDILLSASKDNSIRLWNYIIGKQIMIFGGKEGHEVMVISIDWHFTGKTFCSGGGDRIKIWEVPATVFEINEEIVKEEIDKEKYKKLPLICPFPIFSIDIHCSYVDSIKYIGDIILSKSFNNNGGEIVEWVPFRFTNKEDKENNIIKCLSNEDSQGYCFMILNRYQFPLINMDDKEKALNIFYFKMDYSKEYDVILVGNNQGKTYFFKRNTRFHEDDYVKEEVFYDIKYNKPSLEVFMIDGIIRKSILINKNVVYCVNDYGTVVRCVLKE